MATAVQQAGDRQPPLNEQAKSWIQTVVEL